MNAKVTTVRQANFVTGKEGMYVEITNERGRVVIEIGEKNHKKLLQIVGENVPRETIPVEEIHEAMKTKEGVETMNKRIDEVNAKNKR